MACNTSNNITVDMMHLGKVWYAHVYGFGSGFALCFLLVLGYLMYVLCRSSMQQQGGKSYYCFLLVSTCLCCVTKTIALFVDPYGSKDWIPKIVTLILRDLSFPFLASSAYMLLLALLKLTRMKRLQKRLLSLSLMIIIIVINFLVAIVTDIILGVNLKVSNLEIICIAYFIIFGIICTTGFAYIACKFYQLIYKNRKTLGIQSSTATANQTPTKMPLAMKVAIVVMVTFACHVAVLVIRLIQVVTQCDTGALNSPTARWTLNTVQLSLELFFSFTVLLLCIFGTRTKPSINRHQPPLGATTAI